MEQLLLSTSPAVRPTFWTISNERSVSIFEAFFGQATQRPSVAASVLFSDGNRRLSSSRLVVKMTRTATPGFAPSFLESGVDEYSRFSASEQLELGEETVDFVGGVVVHDSDAKSAPGLETELAHHLDRVVVPVP